MTSALRPNFQQDSLLFYRLLKRGKFLKLIFQQDFRMAK